MKTFYQGEMCREYNGFTCSCLLIPKAAASLKEEQIKHFNKVKYIIFPHKVCFKVVTFRLYEQLKYYINKNNAFYYMTRFVSRQGEPNLSL